MAGPTARVAAARNAVADLRLPAGAHVLVACSGGPDSLALAATLAHVAPRLGWLARAVVVDHSLRPVSAADAAAAASACRDLGLEAEVRTVRVPGEGTGAGFGGPEAAARDVRYAALDAAARAFAPDAVVLLGHTMDDQAESVLLGLARGSGSRSLAGMAPVSGRYRRPFLTLRRADTLGICTDLSLPHQTDPSNALDGHWTRADGGPLLRAALRHTVMPRLEEVLGAGVVPALARTADQLRRDADHLDAEGAALLAAATLAGWALPAGDAPQVVLDVGTLAAAHPAVRSRALRQAILGQADPGVRGSYSARHVDAVDRLVSGYRGQGTADLPGFLTARRDGARLVITRRSGSGRERHGGGPQGDPADGGAD